MNASRLAAGTLLLCLVACATRIPPVEVAGSPEREGAARLIVQLVGLESDDADVAVALYDSAERFNSRTDAVSMAWIRPRDRVATWTVEGLEPGDYAVAAYQDLNGNGRLDRSSLGPPKEPYGFSNDARGTFGPPKFDGAAIRIGPDGLTTEIRLR